MEFIVHIAPQLGARFSQITAEFAAEGTLGPAPAQRFIYVIDGELILTAGGKGHILAPGGFAFLPQGTPHSVRALVKSRAAIIEKPYEPQPGAAAPKWSWATKAPLSPWR